MKKYLTVFLIVLLVLLAAITAMSWHSSGEIKNTQVLAEQSSQNDYWMRLYRKSKKEFLYQGVPGDTTQSTLLKEFTVNVGEENKRPTPLPKLMGKEYWNIIAKYEVKDNPETAPYFLTLDIPWSDEYPFGPTPYNECAGLQCNWVRPGSFGLHGIASTPEKLTDAGSSGCIRHEDQDITYLYNLFNPSENAPIRYYIEDI